MLNAILDVIYNFDLLMLATLGICFLFFLFFMLLGIYAFRKRILSTLFFFLAFIGLFSTPFVITYTSQNFLFKTQILTDYSRPLVFSNAFLIDLTFKNIGKFKFKKCEVIISPKREGKHLKYKLLDLIKPLPQTTHTFYEIVQKNQDKHIEKILPYDAKNKNFKLKLNCR